MPIRLAPRASASLFAFGASFPWPDGKLRFHLGEERCEIGRREAIDRVMLRPPRERRLGRAERARPVDRRAAADAAPLQDVDRLVLRPAAGGFLVELRIGFRFAHPKIGRGPERALFQQHDGKAGGRQYPGGRSAAGAGADDGDIAVVFRVVGQERRVDDAPGARAIGTIRVAHRGVHRRVHASSGGPGYPIAGHEAGSPYQPAKTI